MVSQWGRVLSELGWKQVEGFPVFSRLFQDIGLFFAAMPDVGKGIIPCEIESNKNLDNFMRAYSDRIFIGDLNNTWNLPGYDSVSIDYQVIPSKPKIEKETRSQIRQATKLGVILDDTFNDVGYWECLKDTAQRQERAIMHAWNFRAMIMNTQCLTASLNGKVIAGCMYVDDGEKIHYVHSSSLTDYQKYRPNHLILNRLIEIADGKEIFLGNAPSKLEGLRKFKESFGAEMRHFNLKIYEK